MWSSKGRIGGLVVGLTLLLASTSWAGIGGSPGGGTLSCFMDKSIPNKQTQKFTGSSAVDLNTATLNPDGDQAVDVIVRLQEKNTPPKFFRLRLNTPFSDLSNAARACRIFNPNDTLDPSVAAAVDAFLQEIRLAFSLPANSQFVFIGNFVNGEWDTDQAIYNDESEAANQIIPNTGGTRAGSIADFTVYASW